MAELLSIGTPPLRSTNSTHTCWDPSSSWMVNAGSNWPTGGTILTKRSPAYIRFVQVRNCMEQID